MHSICLSLALIVLAPLPLRAEVAKIKVGFIAALSGPVQAYGEAARNGFELARNEIGDGSIQVVYEDDQFVPTKTISAFNKLAQSDSINLFVCVGSATCNAIAPLAEARRIPLIGWASDTHVSKNRRYVIRSFPSGDEEGKRTIEEGIKRNFSKIAVVTSIHDYPLSWRSGLLAAAPPGSVVLDEQVLPDVQDFKPLLLKARKKGAESFLVCALPGQGAILAKQSRELGMKAKFGGCIFFEDENEVKLANGALSNAWFITTPISPDFIAKYKSKYGNVNTISGAAIHYDLFQLLTRVVKGNHLSDIGKSLMEMGQSNGAAGNLKMQNDNGDQFFNYTLVAEDVKIK